MTWMASISSEGETMTTLARNAFCTMSSKPSCNSAKMDSEGTNISARSWVSPAIRYLAAMLSTCLATSCRKRLPERAPLLLVGQHALQRGHLRSQVGDVSLRVVDDREPLVEFLQVLDGMLAGRGHGLIEMVRDRVEPLVHCAVKLGLPAGEHV